MIGSSVQGGGELVLGKYQVLRRVAVGGMGEVFLACQRGAVAGAERLVIIKTLLPEQAEHPDSVAQFLDEARVTAKLNHPNIVQMIEAALWEGTYVIVLEYIQGETLARLSQSAAAQGHPIPPQVSVRVARAALLGLNHAHTATDVQTGVSLGVVHRDVTPRNIMVRVDGVTKVLDFGISKAHHRTSKTATGNLKGTLRYMSPEQIQGDVLDARTDQFSVGVVLWELLTGRRLFEGNNEIDLFKAVLHQQLQPPSTFGALVPPAWESVVMRMLAREASARFASSADAAEALTALVGNDDGGVEVGSFVRKVCGEEIGVASRSGAIGVSLHRGSLASSSKSDQPPFGDPPIQQPIPSRPTPGSIVSALVVPSTLDAAPTPSLAQRGPKLLVATGLVVLSLVLASFFLGRRTSAPEAEPESEPTAPVSSVAVAVPEAAPMPSVVAPAPAPAPLVAQPTQAAAARGGRAVGQPRPKAMATVVVETVPWSKVTIDGRPFGTTPLPRFTLPAGEHVFEFENPSRPAKRRKIVLKPGDNKVRETLQP